MPKENITSNSACTLRFADKQDIPLILNFIKELASYENLLGEVEATEKRLKKHLFGQKKHAEVLFAEIEDEAVGFALFFHNFSTFLSKPGLYLEDLFVKPEYRKKGIGRKLLEHLAKIAVKRECGRFEWAVLNWNEPAIGFYESLDAKPMDNWTIYRLEGDALKKLAN